MIQFKTLENIAIETLVDTFNEAFAEYFVPIKLTPELLHFKFKTENIALNLSVGAFDNNRLIGFIFHCLDAIDGKKIVYNGGTGVLKDYRGKQITKKMYDYALNNLFTNDLNEVVLEVFDVNIPAIKTYQDVGFNVDEKVFCYSGIVTKKPLLTTFTIKEVDLPNWDVYQKFWEINPTWQNSIPAINRILDKVKIIEVFNVNECIGYAIFNCLNGRIYQIATKKEMQSKGDGAFMLQYISGFNKQLSITNVAENSVRTHNFFKNHLFKLTATQLKMTKILKS